MLFLDRLRERIDVVLCPVALLGLVLLGCGAPERTEPVHQPPRTPSPLEPQAVPPPSIQPDSVGMPPGSGTRPMVNETAKPVSKGPPTPGLLGEFAPFPEGVEPGYMSDRTIEAAFVQPALKIDFPTVENGFGGSPLRESFCARWTGFLHITAKGRYTFFLTSDDGSRLYLDDQLVVNNDGYHGMDERHGAIDLMPGQHAIRVEFFQGGGGAGCQLHWQPEGGERRLLDGDAIWHYRDAKVSPGATQF